MCTRLYIALFLITEDKEWTKQPSAEGWLNKYQWSHRAQQWAAIQSIFSEGIPCVLSCKHLRDTLFSLFFFFFEFLFFFLIHYFKGGENKVRIFICLSLHVEILETQKLIKVVT